MNMYSCSSLRNSVPKVKNIGDCHAMTINMNNAG